MSSVAAKRAATAAAVVLGHVEVAIGTERYCMSYASGVFQPSKKYLAKSAPLPSMCPP